MHSRHVHVQKSPREATQKSAASLFVKNLVNKLVITLRGVQSTDEDAIFKCYVETCRKVYREVSVGLRDRNRKFTDNFGDLIADVAGDIGYRCRQLLEIADVLVRVLETRVSVLRLQELSPRVQ